MLLHKDLAADEPQKMGMLVNRFKAALSSVDRIDVLVGYFYFTGLKVVEEALRAHPNVKVRVLVGMGADEHMGQVVEVMPPTGSPAERKEAVYRQFAKILGSRGGDTRQFQERVDFFLELLAAGRLEVRQTMEPNHAKLWLFHTDPTLENAEWLGEGRLITGSSNFSMPALKGDIQTELDVELKDWGYAPAQAWFDALWEEAGPLALEPERLAEVLCRRRPLTPYEAYLLALDLVVKGTPEDLVLTKRVKQVLAQAGFQEFAYQTDAVAQACSMLERYHGVLLADVVGLGKSIVASLIAAVAPTGRYGIIICPPGLIDNWKDYTKRFGLTQWHVCSCGQLEAVQKILEADPGYTMIVVDEAHRFRNAESQQYADLHSICAGRDVLLLSATPLNNKLDDLEALLALFLPTRENPLFENGDQHAFFAQLQRRMRACRTALRKAQALKDGESALAVLTEHELTATGMDRLQALKLRGRAAVEAAVKERHESYAGAVRAVLEQVVVRRNRMDLLKDPRYKKTLPPLSAVEDPRRIFYGLTQEQDAFYNRVVTEVFAKEGQWRGPIYQPERYRTDNGGRDATQTNIADLMRRMLVRRFESSFAAFDRSLGNMLRGYRNAVDMAERKGIFLYDRKEMEKLQAIEDPDEFEEAYSQVLAELEEKAKLKQKELTYDLNAADFDKETFLADIKADIELLEGLREEVKALRLIEEDPKVEALIAQCRAIIEDDALQETGDPSRKIIVFSEFADTVRFVGARLQAAFKGRVRMVVDTFTKEDREALRLNFDASYSGAQRDDYDILIGTDKISEGLNLNRAGVVMNYDIPWNPTRVLQRLGRINRIGNRVFKKLYTFNCFPTLRGENETHMREIAESKLFAIHKTLGEDVKLFDEGEEPTASELWKRIGKQDEQIGPLAELRQKHEALLKADPEIFERVREALPRAKAARDVHAEANEAAGLLQLRGVGDLLQAFVMPQKAPAVTLALSDLVKRLECSPEEPSRAEAFRSEAIWAEYERLAHGAQQIPPTPSDKVWWAANENMKAALALLPKVQEEMHTLVWEALRKGRMAHRQIAKLARTKPENPATFAVFMKELQDVAAAVRLAGKRPTATEPQEPTVELTVALVGDAPAAETAQERA